VAVDSFDGLLVDYASAQRRHVLLRGIRAISDYEYELQMALMNRRLRPDIETVFMMASEAHSFISSRLVKEVFGLGGNIGGLVPPPVEVRLRKRFAWTKGLRPAPPGRKRRSEDGSANESGNRGAHLFDQRVVHHESGGRCGEAARARAWT
jgi:hypothetical protein